MASMEVDTSSRFSNDCEEYKIAYSTYLLRKLQNHVAKKQKQEKEEEFKKCLTSFKLEFEELLKTHVALRNDISYFTLSLDYFQKVNKNIEWGKEVLKTLEDSNFDRVLLNLSRSLNLCNSQLRLTDISKEEFEDLLNKKLLGSGSEMENSLKLINEFIEQNKFEISNIADEIRSIKKLWEENSVLRERFSKDFNSASNDILDKNYKHLIEKIKNCLEAKEKLILSGCPISGNLFNSKDIFKYPSEVSNFLDISRIDTSTKRDFLQITNLGEEEGGKPRCSSTPHKN